MKGLSSTALQKTTSLAQPKPPRSAVRSAAALMVPPMRATASMLMPALVEPTFTEEHTRSVTARASGMAAMSLLVPVGHALLHQGGEAADEVDAAVVWAARSRAVAKGT